MGLKIPIDADFYAGLESDVKSLEFPQKQYVLIISLSDLFEFLDFHSNLFVLSPVFKDVFLTLFAGVCRHS